MVNDGLPASEAALVAIAENVYVRMTCNKAAMPIPSADLEDARQFQMRLFMGLLAMIAYDFGEGLRWLNSRVPALADMPLGLCA
jgi:hypothetical protein